MDEFSFIRTLLAPLSLGAAGAYNLRDDAAVLTPPAGRDLVLTADALTAGVHFRATDPPDLIARKALRVNLSDLAAKGATAAGFLMTLSLPRDITEKWLTTFSRGLGQDVNAFEVPLLGGDTTTTPGPLSISITAIGHVTAGGMIRRVGARPGDVLCVSGTIGDGALGLIADELPLPEDERNLLQRRYELPEPRLGLGRTLSGVATAALDVSDGLIADAAHLCEQGNVAARIERHRIPLSPAAAHAVKKDATLWQRILGGGDDYEIAFTAAPGADLKGLEQASHTPITVIGQIELGAGVRVFDEAGIEYPVAKPGYRHF